MQNNKEVLDTGEIVCGFAVRKTYEGQKDFDQTYKEVTIKQRVKKIGDGENDFVIEEYEDVKEIPIREVIDAQVDQVGIEAFMRPYQMAGLDLPGVEVSDNVDDFSQMPEDPADIIKVGDEMMKKFNSLPEDLRGDAKTPEEFFKSFSQEKFDAWLASKTNVEKDEEKKYEK